MQNFSELCPSPFYKDFTNTCICYLPTLWVLVGQRAMQKISTKIWVILKGGLVLRGEVVLERESDPPRNYVESPLDLVISNFTNK